jgi:hypothetical protein
MTRTYCIFNMFGYLLRCNLFLLISERTDQSNFCRKQKSQLRIVSDSFWKKKTDSLYDNPCRKGLVCQPADGRFPSARFWLLREKLDVELSDVGWD